jgi:hypothetical protein
MIKDKTKREDIVYKALAWSSFKGGYYEIKTKSGNGLYTTYHQAAQKLTNTDGKVVQYQLTVIEEEIFEQYKN